MEVLGPCPVLANQLGADYLFMSAPDEASIGLLVEGELTDTKEDQRIDDTTQDQQYQDDVHRVPGLSPQQFDSVSSGPGLHRGEQHLPCAREGIREVRQIYAANTISKVLSS